MLDILKSKTQLYAIFRKPNSVPEKQAQSEGWKMILQAKGIPRKASVPILISDKIDFEAKKVTRDKVDIL